MDNGIHIDEYNIILLQKIQLRRPTKVIIIFQFHQSNRIREKHAPKLSYRFQTSVRTAL